MSDSAVVVKTRKFMRNPLLSRRQVCFFFIGVEVVNVMKELGARPCCGYRGVERRGTGWCRVYVQNDTTLITCYGDEARSCPSCMARGSIVSTATVARVHFDDSPTSHLPLPTCVSFRFREMKKCAMSYPRFACLYLYRYLFFYSLL